MESPASSGDSDAALSLPSIPPTARSSPSRPAAMDLTYKIVRRLLRDDEVEFSRNKNFEAYDDPTVERAVRIYRHLASVERDILNLGPGGDVLLEDVDRDDDEEWVLKLTFADGDGRRVSYLNPKDWKVLLENRRVSDRLEAFADEADPETGRLLREMLDAPDASATSS